MTAINNNAFYMEQVFDSIRDMEDVADRIILNSAYSVCGRLMIGELYDIRREYGTNLADGIVKWTR